MTPRMERASEVSDEQLRAAVTARRNLDEGRRDQTNSKHGLSSQLGNEIN
jgi:hypothetical protein